jgi:hypothetical protein
MAGHRSGVAFHRLTLHRLHHSARRDPGGGEFHRAVGFRVWPLFKVPIGTGLAGAVVRYLATLAGVYVLALIIDALAPSFGGQKSQIQALKLAAYSSTASWLAGIFMIIPSLSILSIVGLYSLYLLFIGLPVMMKSPQDKSLGYTVVVILCAIVLFAIVGAITSRMMGYGSWY